MTDVCVYHPGVPVFHDALKVEAKTSAWSDGSLIVVLSGLIKRILFPGVVLLQTKNHWLLRLPQHCRKWPLLLSDMKPRLSRLYYLVCLCALTFTPLGGTPESSVKLQVQRRVFLPSGLHKRSSQQGEAPWAGEAGGEVIRGKERRRWPKTQV